MHALSLFALLLPLVAADTGYSHHWLCYHVYTNTASWSESEGRCIATVQPIPGDDWQTNCIIAGVQKGYYAFDTKGNPITNVPAMKVDTAVGNCD
ncbi:uncharacterized protein CPUR_03095 [Claviceps purpurea 20.1]|uniref:Uncharacterized protein n=1 Tax=Claviceps purpurea (strain 20.1) TaxID=1111077 RepID=M1VVE9_CLAP2|nr:uncharacterized protein CPUR_03095 [Claviceps purpurea 20.1]